MLNRVILMGRLTSDPELKTIGTGASVTNFSIAVDRGYVKQGEERKADFFNIVAWRQTAEFICKYFSKGAMIAVDGQLQSRAYTAQDGTNRHIVEVLVTNAYFTGERRENQGGYAQQGGYTPQTAPQQTPPAPSYQSGSTGDFIEMPLDDDLPF